MNVTIFTEKESNYMETPIYTNTLIYEKRDFYSKNIKKMSIYKSIVVDLTNGKIK